MMDENTTDEENDKDNQTNAEKVNIKFAKHADIDEGYAWVVLLALFMSDFIRSILYTFGLFNVVFLEVFGKSKETTAWVTATSLALRDICAPLASVLIMRIGARPTFLLGVLLSTAGYLWAALATDFTQVLISFGIIIGISSSPTYVTGSVVIKDYFIKYRNFAYGFVSMGLGIGALVFPVVVESLLEMFGWRGTLMIVAGINLQNAIVATLLRPQISYSITNVAVTNNMASSEKPSACTAISDDIPPHDSSGLPIKFGRGKTRLPLLKSLFQKNFLLFCCVSFVAIAACNLMIIHFVAFSVHHGTTLRQSSYLLVIDGVLQIISRPGIGTITNRKNANVLCWFMFALGFIGIGNCLAPTVATGFTGQAVYVAVISLLTSVYHTLYAPVMITICDKETFPIGLGIATFFGGIGTLLAPPFAGWLFDMSGTYAWTMYFSGR